jgi:hypothetical protein
MKQCIVIVPAPDGKKCSAVPNFSRKYVLGAVSIALGIPFVELKMPSISPSQAIVALPDGSRIEVELAQSFDGSEATRLLTEFVKDVEAAGGVRRSGGAFAPVADEDWTDLGITYMKACEALGRKVVFAQ